MDVKSLRVEIKDADKGEISAVFATYNVVDHDGDVTLPGAFTDGAPVTISAYGHKSWEGLLPVGRGVIRADGEKAWLEGRFFLNTTAGRDTFEVVKELKDLQEFSYGYDAEEFSYGDHEGRQVRFLRKQLVHEVSPVLKGAGIGTRVLGVKNANIKFADEAQAVVAAVRALSDRAADVMAKRQEKGKALGADSQALVEQVAAELKRLNDLLTEPEMPVNGDLEREFLRFMTATR